jgi:protein involved in sex pheromone biosynthesis
MKKLAIIFLVLFLLLSCSTKPKDENLSETNSWITNSEEVQEEQKWAIREAVDIIDNYYTETLPGSIRDAKDVVNDINARQNDLQKELDGLR